MTGWFYNGLSFLAWYIPKLSVLIISRDMNAQIGKDDNDKFCLHNLLNRNGDYLANFSLENSFSCLKMKFHKRAQSAGVVEYAECISAEE